MPVKRNRRHAEALGKRGHGHRVKSALVAERPPCSASRKARSTRALTTGLITGLAIAMQVGAVGLLLVEAAVVAGRRAGVAAGMGVATADVGFAAIAAAAGGVAGPALSSHVREIRAAGGLVLAAIALQGLVALARNRSRPPRPQPPAARRGRSTGASWQSRRRTRSRSRRSPR